jgi:3-hydroxyisobutyrate dehydrogenase
MGSRMAAQLLQHGHDVVVWNRSSEKTAPLVEQGATAADTPRAAADGTDYVVSMVRDDDASRDVWLNEEHGALAGMSADAVAIESTTVTVTWAQQLAEQCSQRGISFLDAPVSGSLPQAEATQLVFLVGGEQHVVERVQPLLLAMGSTVQHVGPAGSGAATKLVVNTLLGVQAATVGELLGVVARLGFDQEKVVDALGATSVCSPYIRVAANAMLQENFKALFPIELVAKDLTYSTRTGTERGASMPMADAARDVFTHAVEKGYGDDNVTGVVQLYR